MNLETICAKVMEGGAVGESEVKFESLSMEEIRIKSESDRFAKVVLKALEANGDNECDLYLHQYRALYALAEGKDVLLISPCGSGKTRVLNNAPVVAKLGYELCSEVESEVNPLGIVCCPLTSIMEDKLKDTQNAGMISMYGRGTLSEKNKEDLSNAENEFLSDKLSYIYGHPESFATEIGRKILESNEDRIYVFVCDEVGYNVWGPDFRILMSSVPGSIRVFSSSNAPMLCMSATIGKADQVKVKEDLGMVHRKCEVIDFNPVMPNIFLAKLRRPSNQKGFYEPSGLKDILCSLFLNEFISDPLNSRKAIIFCKNELDLIQVYEFLEHEIGKQFTNMKSRPWVQYHGSTGERTLSWIHHRLKCDDDLEVKLLISTYKIVMGVDLKDLDLAIFIRYNFSSQLFRLIIPLLVRPPNTIPCLVQGLGRVGRSLPFGSRKAAGVILYNDEDIKPNAPGMTQEMRDLLTTSACLKNKLADSFGYSFTHTADWCCSN